MRAPEMSALQGIGGDWHVVYRDPLGCIHSVRQGLTQGQAIATARELNNPPTDPLVSAVCDDQLTDKDRQHLTLQRVRQPMEIPSW